MAVRYSTEIAERICADLAKGMTLKQVCRQDGMPDESSVRQWALEKEDFAPLYARARELGYQVMADELIEIADNGTNDWMKREEERTGVQAFVDHDHVTRSRLRLDTRKWLLAKALPKVYGDKLTTENVTLGPDGKPIDPTKVIHTVTIK